MSPSITPFPVYLAASPIAVVGPSTALVAATKPSCIACGTSIMQPVTSPAAKIWGTDVRKYSSTFTESPTIDFNASRSEVEGFGLGPPAHRHNSERCLCAVPYGIFREDHPHPRRRLLEGTRWTRNSHSPRCSNSRKASATAADTSSSSLGRMRGPASNSWNS